MNRHHLKICRPHHHRCEFGFAHMFVLQRRWRCYALTARGNGPLVTALLLASDEVMDGQLDIVLGAFNWKLDYYLALYRKYYASPLKTLVLLICRMSPHYQFLLRSEQRWADIAVKS